MILHSKALIKCGRSMRDVLKLAALSSALVLAACGGGGSDGAGVSFPVAWQMPSATPALVANVATDTRQTREVVPGITLYNLTVGSVSADDGFEVTVGFVRNQADAVPLTDALKSAGYSTKFVGTVDNAATGYAVRLDKRYATMADADAVVTAIKALTTLPAASEKLAVGAGRVFTAEDGGATKGPYRLSLLAVRPSFKGTLKSALGTDIIPGRETTTSLANRTGALAAINGGFFQLDFATGTAGGLAGLSVIDGRLVSEGVEGRPALFIEKSADGTNTARVERKISTVISVSVNAGVAKRIDGTNRRPQVAANCGRPFDKETSIAMHDAICTNDNAIIVYTPDFGSTVSTGSNVTVPVVEVVLDASGAVTAVNTQSGSNIPARGQVLQGIGSGAQWLASNISVGSKVNVTRKLINGSGKEIALNPGVYAINGGPTLLVDGGTVESDAAMEGWGNANVAGYPWFATNGNRANFYNGWYLRRNPRTAVGVAADGTILMLVSDGRAPMYSAGLSISETSLVLKHFGAVSAINLDGGGSSMMVVGGVQQTRPSDAGNIERADGDALLIFSK